MTQAERDEAARSAAAFRFQETVWEGCADLDCLPGCSLKLDDMRCVRFEQAFQTWLVENHPELVKLPQNGGAA